MFTQFFKVAIRNFLKYKTFSFINIFGLALSMSLCLLIILLIKDAHSYDLFHQDGDKIYRILTTAERKNGKTESYASSPYIVAQTLQQDYAQVEAWAPLLRNFNGTLLVNGQSFDYEGLFADPSFFEMFGFQLAEGNPETALSEPYSIVLTDEMARLLYDNTDPVGEILTISGYETPFRVTGVLKPFPGKTHLEFSALGSLSTQVAQEKLPDWRKVTTNWQDYYRSYNYIRLSDKADRETIEEALAQIAASQYAGLELESRDAGYRFSLQPLYEITPGRLLSNSMGRGMPLFLIWFLTALGLSVILSACFNYTNLTIARSFLRTKEIGVRKVLGATRSQVFWQFISEAVITALIALALAYPLMKWAQHQFGQLSIANLMDLRLEEDWMLYALFLVFAIAVGIIAGWLPAATLSRARPATILQKLRNVKFLQRVGLRKALTTIQFTITLILLLVMTVVMRQTNYALKINFGFDQPSTLLVDLQGQPFSKVAAALGQVNGVEAHSGISFAMGTFQDASIDVRTAEENEKTGVRYYFIDDHYLSQFGIPLLAGQNFPDNPSQSRELFAIVNETFLKDFNLGAPAEAVGKPLILEDSIQVSIRGITADFPFKPAVYSMEPLLLRYDPAQLGVLNLELAGGGVLAVRSNLEKAWKKLDTGKPFEAQFFDEVARDNFSNILDLLRLVFFFGILGMVIACLGLLGMVIYSIETRAREIGIRKVLGASVLDVVSLLSRGYLVLFGIAVLIAVPVSFLLGNQMLQMFADRIPWSVGLFLPGILLLLAVAALTISSQTIRAATANPAAALKSE
ncbi:MAG: ABC transporter permease [Lewinellaceae bacterium]|nr:ABC transporter permease [Lewinellaceae bacterium]